MILLDTSPLLWVLSNSPRMGPRSRERLMLEPRIYASSVSTVEIVIKQMTGRLSFDGDLIDAISSAGFAELPLRHADGVSMHNFTELVGHDPFDRMLVAQAEANGMDFLTSDRRLLALGRSDIVDATE